MWCGVNNSRVMAQLNQPFINNVEVVKTFRNENNIFLVMKFRAMNFRPTFPLYGHLLRVTAAGSQWEASN